MSKLKVLITGGAGYVGTVLTPLLLKAGFRVTVFDRLLWGGDPILPFFADKNFDFIRGDIRNREEIGGACAKHDVIVHLASIVGYPACDMNRELTLETNIGGSKNIAKSVNKSQTVIFASSGSNYGRVLEGICTEETPLAPITTYSVTKTEAEKILMDGTSCIALRPGTAFGSSPRLRMDLLVHQLTAEAYRTKKLVLYEADAVRPFLHVYDFARAVIFAILNKDKMVDQAYNLGVNELNFTKRQIAEKIAAKTGAAITIGDGSDPDQRTYRVSYDKLQNLGFSAEKTMEDGISEILKILPALVSRTSYPNPYSNANKYE